MTKNGKRLVRFFLLINGLMFLFPLYWMINLSFKEAKEVYVNPFGLPHSFDANNFSEVLEKVDFLHYLKNSAIYTISTIVLVLLLGSMLAYALTRLHWKHASLVTSYISIGLIIPVQVIIIPLYMMNSALHIKGTHLGLILPYTAFAMASCVLMLSAFMRGIPKELEEAASIDGCSVYRTFFSVIVPYIRPALSTQAILIFMNTWNEFFLAFILGAKDEIRPLTVALLDFFTSIGVADWGQIGAVMILSSLPTVIIYLFGSKQIENALTAGAILK